MAARVVLVVCTVAAVGCLMGGPAIAGAVAASPPGQLIDRTALESAHQRLLQWRQWLSSPAAVDERGQSRQAYVGEDADAALTTARAKFADVIDADAWRAPGSGDGTEVLGYLDDSAARVRMADGQTAVVSGTVPLRARDDAGELAPVDLRLEKEGAAYVARNPLVAVRLPEKASGAIGLSDQNVSVRLAGASDAPAALHDDKLFFANAWADTDVALVPEPGGVSATFLLRSPASPESFTLTYDLPAGASLRLAQADAGEEPIGAEIVDASGDVIARVKAPLAYDAQGSAIPVHYEVDGDTLLVEMPHRGQSLAYPLLVDPTTTTRDAFGQDTTESGSWDFWSSESTQPFKFTKTTDTIAVSALLQSWYYFDDSYGVWVYNPPANSYVTQVQTRLINYAPMTSYFAQGIYSDALGALEAGRSTGINGVEINCCQAGAYEYSPLSGQLRVSTASAPHYDNKVIVGVQVSGAGTRDGRLHADVGGAYTWESETKPPTVSFKTSSAWQRGTQMVLHATDVGLGVKWLNLKVDGVDQTPIDDCVKPDGDRRHWCLPDPPDRSVSLGEGLHDVSAQVTDVVGNTSTSVAQKIRFDNSAPTVSLSGTLYDHRVGGGASDPVLRNGQYGLHVVASDGVASPGSNAQHRSGVASIKVQMHNDSGDGPISCSSADGPAWATLKDYGQNPQSGDNAGWTPADLNFSPAAYAPGVRTVRVTTTDAAGNVARNCFDVDLNEDSSAPSVTLSGVGDTALDSGTVLHVHAQDGTDEAPGSGVRVADVSVDGTPASSYQGSCSTENGPDGSYEQCDQSLDGDFVLSPLDYSEGEHTVTVTATDAAGNVSAPKSRTVYVLGLGAVDESKLGLENYFGYESMPTGADSTALVNVATGNLVWHSIPVDDVGRGLSSVMNLTYNSLDRGGYVGSLIKAGGEPLVGATAQDLAGTAYGEAGIGFSIGISGITRLNEPLIGVQTLDGDSPLSPLPPEVGLVDSDGTRHEFESDPGRTGWYVAPAGVQLALHRDDTADASRRWAATRPDGVTFFFDADGYQTAIDDRNGNEIRFEYEHYSKVTGKVSDCDGSPAPELLCTPRVKRIIDPVGSDAQLVGQPEDPRVDARSIHIEYYDNPVLPVGGDPSLLNAPLVGPVGGAAGHIKRIIDHAHRVTEFSYDADGYLTRLSEGAVQGPDGTDPDTSDERTFALSYSGSGQNRVLHSVTDPRGNATTLEYKQPDQPGLAGAHSVGLPVTAITNRRDNRTTYDLAGSTLTATAPGVAKTTYTTDGAGRPTDIVDPISNETVIGWDADNNLNTLERAHGTPDAATSSWEFDTLGDLVRQEDPNHHVTTYAYRYGTEAGPVAGGTDDGINDVADLTSVTPPRGNTVTFTPDSRGNVTGRAYQGEPAATTAYDSRGQITSETDEVGNATHYEDYDDSGQPQTVIDARGGRWLYRYDPVGNVLTVTDPRGSAAAPHEPYTTSVTYDAFDRPTALEQPKLSAPASGSPAWIERQYGYDANGNRDTLTDGDGRKWTETYTPMDRLDTQVTPAIDHAGEDAAAPETTAYHYDARENLAELVRPEGTRTSLDGDFTTSYGYDAADRLLTEARQSRGDGDAEDLITSYAYDHRDNLVGIADPRHNAQGGDPAANASSSAKQRWSFSYDAADNRTDAVEDPAAKARHTHWTFDANDDVSDEIDPRGMGPSGPTADASSYTTHYAYDSRDDVTDVTEGDQRHTHYGRRADGLVHTVVKPKGTASDDPSDYTTTYDYDANDDVSSITLPHDPDEPRAAGTITYSRDEVGDPTKITDPRGHDIVNTFYDTGDLLTTTRPSLWQFDPQGSDGPELVERPYDQWQLFDGQQPTLPTSAGQGDFGAVQPEAPSGVLPRAGSTSFQYDDEMRLTHVTDARSQTTVLDRDALGRIATLTQPFKADSNIVTSWRFDRAGNLRFVDEPQDDPASGQYSSSDYRTTIDYDQFDRWINRTDPGAAAGVDDPSAISPRVTQATWDPNDNELSETKPRGKTTRMTYDAVDQLDSITDPLGHVTTYGYDANGNQTCERRPRGNNDGERACAEGPYATTRSYDRFDELASETRHAQDSDGNDQTLTTTFDYDADGNTTGITTPGAASAADAQIQPQVQTARYDGRDQLWTETTGTGSDALTRVYEHDPNGNLRRVVNPAGVGDNGLPTQADSADAAGAPSSDAEQHATVFELDADNELTDIWLPAGGRDAADQRRYRQHFERDPVGRVLWIDSPYTASSDRTVRTSYAYYDSGWIRQSSAEHWVDPDSDNRVLDHQFNYDYSPRGLQTSWKLGDSGRSITRSYYPSGDLRQRTAKASDSDGSPRSYDYAYDSDGNLAQMRDNQQSRNWNMARDDADQLLSVNEAWSTGKDTKYAYDKDGNVTDRFTDGHLDASADTGYQGGKQTTFAYDSIGRELKSTVAQDGESDRRVTTTTWWPSGDHRERTKSNSTVERWFYDDQDRLVHRDRLPQSGAADHQDYDYARAFDGNRTKDERGSYEYNSRDQLVKWTRNSGDAVTYDLNGSGAITRKVDGDTTVDYALQGDQINTATASTTGASQTFYFRYDGAGDMTCLAATANDGGCTGGDKYTYDDFDRLTSATKASSPNTPTSYAYDGLDRRDWRCTGGSGSDCTGGTRHDYSYIGLSDLRSSQQESDGTRRTFDYDSSDERLGTDRIDSNGTNSYRPYATDANGSVVGLEDDTGQLGDRTYAYDPYGEQTSGPGDDADAADARDNPFRFEGFAYDEGVDTYDMLARPYSPNLGRFLALDVFEDATGDFALQADPLTNNRYAFTAGNPVNNLEFDGHCAPSGESLYTPCRAMPGTPRRTARRINRRADRAGARIDAQRAQSNRATAPTEGFDEESAGTQPTEHGGGSPWLRTAVIWAPHVPVPAVFKMQGGGGVGPRVPEERLQPGSAAPPLSAADLAKEAAAARASLPPDIRDTLQGQKTSPFTSPAIDGPATGEGLKGESATAAKGVEATRGGVYSLRDEAGNVVRTGRTSDLARRRGQHFRNPNLGQYRFQPEYRTDDYATQRGLEQLLHEEYVPPLNKINPISPFNPRRDFYLRSARDFLEGGG